MNDDKTTYVYQRLLSKLKLRPAISRLTRPGKAAALPLLMVVWLLLVWTLSTSTAAGYKQITSMIGPKDALLVADPDGNTIISKNSKIKLVPASILKIFTSLVALHYLGADYRYSTEFYMDKNSNLKIKGYGDPLLISEVVREICRSLAGRVGRSKRLQNLILDDSYFNRPLTIPGISSSSQPYDAPNGALCVNFNTVYFKRTKSGYASAEPQTPLLPYAAKKIRASRLKNGRIVLSHVANENTIYAGKLFQYFLQREGIQFRGTVKKGWVDHTADQLVYRYVSHFSLTQIIAKLLEHSNNFTTNQLLITAGARASGPPGNLKKAVAAAQTYAANYLQIKNMAVVEGSGISRNNRVSAHQMQRVLKKFEPYRSLMRREGREYYKTGTLYGVSTRAGYIEGKDDGVYRYVVMINSPGKSTKPVMRKLLKSIQR